MSEWRFTNAVPTWRVSQLFSWDSFEQIIDGLCGSSIEKFWWESFRGTSLVGCHRASFAMKVLPSLYDAFFNSPVGYRAQYAASPAIGETANRCVITALQPLLLRAIDGQTGVSLDLVARSLRAFEAKIWIDETEVDDQLSAISASIAYPAWEFHTLDGQGLRAPMGTTLEVKGGWIDSEGSEKRNPTKARRSFQIFSTGFS